MPRLGKMLHQMSRYRKQWEVMMKASSALQPSPHISETPSRLTEIAEFGPNPGNLRMFTYVPQSVATSPALVVVLHGCTQNAALYDRGSGWSELADRHGFVLLYPEQKEANNPKRCFNWFLPNDTARGSGEVASIREMIERISRDHAIDRDRVFVTGLSAGGAMTSAMLAAYPDVFKGGAIIAGLPYGSANNVPEAFESMFQGRTLSAQEWGDFVRNASSHRGPWPRISVWHGSADTTVKHVNATEIIKQWTDVHGLPNSPSRSETVDGYPRRIWTDAAGEELIEEYVITGMAHGTPLSSNGDNSLGAAGPFMLDAGISSSYHIARFWGLTERSAAGVTKNPLPEARWAAPASDVAGRAGTDQGGRDHAAPSIERNQDKSREQHPSMDIGAVISKALKAAGLMK